MAILDAAEALLETGAWNRTSVVAITSEAGCSVGAFYGRFSGKEDVLRALYARYRDQSQLLLQTALRPDDWQGVPLTQVIEALCAFLVEDFRQRRGLRRAFLEAAMHDSAIRELVGELSQTTIEVMRRLLETRADEIAHADPAVAADFCHRIAFAILDQNLVATDLQPIEDEVLRTELSRALVGYLGVSA